MNNTIFFFFYNLAHQSEIFDKLVVFLAVYFPYLVVFLAGIFLLMSRRFSRDPDLVSQASGHHTKYKEILSVVFSGILAYATATILKFLFHVSRPILALSDIHPLFTKTTFSFPSEHATFFMVLAVSIFFFHKKAGYIFMFFALLIGIARIIAGVHFPIDILGGFVLGALVAYFVKKI